MFFTDDVSRVFLSARLPKRQEQLQRIKGRVRKVLINSWFIVDPRMSFPGVKVAHECGGEFTHDAVVTPAFVSESEGKGDEAREKVVLMYSPIDEDGAIDCAVVGC